MTKFKPNRDLTQARLKQILRYNRRTGLFHWRKPRPRIQVGARAGSLMPSGYIRITVDRHRFMAHTLAWLYVTGEYIARGLDHRDTVPSNNKFANLRRADKSQNRMNSKVRSDCKCGVKGVRERPNGTFSPQITLPGQKAKSLGTFKTAEAAAAVYAAAAREHFGEFARIK